MALAIVKAQKNQNGIVTLKINSEGLEEAIIQISCK
jgi:hypothetical protein